MTGCPVENSEILIKKMLTKWMSFIVLKVLNRDERKLFCQLENLLKKEQEEDKVDWKKFEDLEKKNKQLDEESKNSAEEKNQDNKPEEKKEDTKGDQNAKEKESEDQDSDSDQNDGEQKDGEQKPNDSQQQMKHHRHIAMHKFCSHG